LSNHSKLQVKGPEKIFPFSKIKRKKIFRDISYEETYMKMHQASKKLFRSSQQFSERVNAMKPNS
jgi:hypothetical protein